MAAQDIPRTYSMVARNTIHSFSTRILKHRSIPYQKFHYRPPSARNELTGVEIPFQSFDGSFEQDEEETDEWRWSIARNDFDRIK